MNTLISFKQAPDFFLNDKSMFGFVIMAKAMSYFYVPVAMIYNRVTKRRYLTAFATRFKGVCLAYQRIARSNTGETKLFLPFIKGFLVNTKFFAELLISKFTFFDVFSEKATSGKTKLFFYFIFSSLLSYYAAAHYTARVLVPNSCLAVFAFFIFLSRNKENTKPCLVCQDKNVLPLEI